MKSILIKMFEFTNMVRKFNEQQIKRKNSNKLIIFLTNKFSLTDKKIIDLTEKINLQNKIIEYHIDEIKNLNHKIDFFIEKNN